MSPRDCRRAELSQMQATDPEKLVGAFRFIKGLNEFSHLPQGSTFASVIEAILDHEEATGKWIDGLRQG